MEKTLCNIGLVLDWHSAARLNHILEEMSNTEDKGVQEDLALFLNPTKKFENENTKAVGYYWENVEWDSTTPGVDFVEYFMFTQLDKDYYFLKTGGEGVFSVEERGSYKDNPFKMRFVGKICWEE